MTANKIDALIEALEEQMLAGGMTPEEIKEFAIATNHPHECNCELCRKWWKEMGREE